MSFTAAKFGLKKREEIPEDFDRDCFETPPEVFRYLHKKYDFKMDLAADPNNPHSQKLEEFYGPEDDALTRPWPKSGYLFLNFPFSQGRKWIQKVQAEAETGCRVVVLCNAGTAFTNYYSKRPAEHEYKIIGRLSFCVNGVPVHGNEANQVVLVFNKKLKPKHGMILLSEIFGPE